MEILQLEYFLSVVEHGGIIKAARALHISQPSLSMTMQKLSGEVGFPLFGKSGRGLMLSETGRLFFRYCVKAMDALRRGQEALRKENYHLTVRTKFSPIFLSQAILQYLEQYPQTTIQMDCNQPQTPLTELGLNEMSFFYALTPPTTPHSLALGVEDIALCVPASHPLAKQKSVPFCSLAHEDLILLATRYSGLQDLIERQCLPYHLCPNIVMFHDSAAFIEQAVLAHTGLALVPVGSYINGISPALKLLRITAPELRSYVCVSYHEPASEHSPFYVFSHYMMEYFQNNAPTIEQLPRIQGNGGVQESV